MTQCIGSPAQEMAEQYLLGELQGPEAEQFENHFFSCELCHEQLRTLMDVREVLAAGPVAGPAIVAAAPGPRIPAPRKQFSTRILAFPVPMAVLGSIAAMLLVVAVLVSVQRSAMAPAGHGESAKVAAPPQQTAPGIDTAQTPAAVQKTAARGKDSDAKTGSTGSGDTGSGDTGGSEKSSASESALPTELALMADVHLPGYQAPQLRGGDVANADHAEFTTGMQAYAQGDCSSALPALAKVPSAAPDGLAAKLYSGLCELQGRQLDQAQASFTVVTAAGDTPELETAEYFIAQTLLLRGDAAGAKDWLNRTVALHGDYEVRAQQQIAQLPH